MKKTVLAFLAFFLMAAPACAAEDLMGMYQTYQGDSQMALDQPHRGIKELSEWISDVGADALVFAPGKASEKLAKLRPMFSDNGYKSYLEFLTASGLAEAVQAQTLSMTTIVKNAPMLMGQGASAGRYAWAFELPVVMTVTGKDGAPASTKNATLRIQFGRSVKGPAPHGVLIESWQEFKEGTAAQDSGQPVTTP